MVESTGNLAKKEGDNPHHAPTPRLAKLLHAHRRCRSHPHRTPLYSHLHRILPPNPTSSGLTANLYHPHSTQLLSSPLHLVPGRHAHFDPTHLCSNLAILGCFNIATALQVLWRMRFVHSINQIDFGHWTW